MPTGQAFIGRLAELTGADVAASRDATGSAALGGNWNLEATTGAIETGVAIDAAAQARVRRAAGDRGGQYVVGARPPANRR